MRSCLLGQATSSAMNVRGAPVLAVGRHPSLLSPLLMIRSLRKQSSPGEGRLSRGA